MTHCPECWNALEGRSWCADCTWQAEFARKAARMDRRYAAIVLPDRTDAPGFEDETTDVYIRLEAL